MPERHPGGNPTAVPGPPSLPARVAAWVALAQAAGLVALAVVVAVEAAHGDRSTMGNVVLLALLLVAWAGGLAAAARGLLRRRRRARAPLVVSELLLLAVGIPLVQGTDARWAGVLLVVTCVAGLLTVLSPAVTAQLQD